MLSPRLGNGCGDILTVTKGSRRYSPSASKLLERIGGNMEFDHVKTNLEKTLERISLAAGKAGRSPDEVVLVAVSKTFPFEAVEAAAAAGQRVFGENRVQELASKVAAAAGKDFEWHLIGHLQTNKAAKAVHSADMIHSVDSSKLLAKLAGVAAAAGVVQKILLEVNVSGEAAKFGLPPGEVASIMEAAAAEGSLAPCGLMTMAPFGASDLEARRIFAVLRGIRDKLESDFGIELPELSMGMSSDFESAILEGATLVRVGTAIFGERN